MSENQTAFPPMTESDFIKTVDNINTIIEWVPCNDDGSLVSARVHCSFYHQKQDIYLTIKEAKQLQEKLSLALRNW